MVKFKYAPTFQLGKDDTEYRLISKKGISVDKLEDKGILKVSKEALTLLMQKTFHDREFMLRRTHSKQAVKILTDPEASENDKYMAPQSLHNAGTAVKGVLPFCQDMGTAIARDEKGQQVWTGFKDEEALSHGIFSAFTGENLCYLQNTPLSIYDEVNIKCNLPAQIGIEAVEGTEYRFVTVVEGGGSANKTCSYPMTKATIQDEGTFIPFLTEKVESLGTAAYPPYHIYFAIGGTSTEKDLPTVRLGGIKYYDDLPTTDDGTGRTLRGIDLEKRTFREACKIGLGTQLGGKYSAHDVHIIRLPHHGTSYPIGMGASCSVDRNIKAKINKGGIWLEKTDTNPNESTPEKYYKSRESAEGVEINLGKGMDTVCAELIKYPVSTRVNLKGAMIVARDTARAKLKTRLDVDEELLDYIRDYPVLYAGPAKTPGDYSYGSMGPTAANHVDPYVDGFQKHGDSLVMIAEDNRTQAMTNTYQKHGGFYLGTVGGVTTVPPQGSIKSIEYIEYPEFDMETVWKITAEDFLAFVLTDDKDRNFFKELKPWTDCNCEK